MVGHRDENISCWTDKQLSYSSEAFFNTKRRRRPLSQYSLPSNHSESLTLFLLLTIIEIKRLVDVSQIIPGKLRWNHLNNFSKDEKGWKQYLAWKRYLNFEHHLINFFHN